MSISPQVRFYRFLLAVDVEVILWLVDMKKDDSSSSRRRRETNQQTLLRLNIRPT
jgi:hypothetical protein